MLFAFFFAFIAFQQLNTISCEEITSWEEFKLNYNKVYSSPKEESERKLNFLAAQKWILENNAKENGMTFAINQFADLSKEEFSSQYLIKQKDVPQIEIDQQQESEDLPYEDLADHFDWREHIKMNPIENQANCGSCWAFATGAVVEAAYAIKRNRTVRLSKQEIIDCTENSYDHEYDNYGCKSGLPVEALKYVIKHGLVEETYYSYLGVTGVCQDKNLIGKERFHIGNYGQLPFNVSDVQLMQTIKNYGPVIVSIYAFDEGFRFLKSGIMPPIPNLVITAYQTTHTVVLIGWGRSPDGVDYWILRNQWGESWADGGYAKLQRHHNTRGVNLFVQYPILQ